MTTAALEISGVARHFGGLVALSDASFRVEQGEILGLIGPNGAGKSTLFEIIGGNLRPTAGRVSYFGRDVTRVSPHQRRRAGLCRTFQKIRLFETLSVYENVSVAAIETSAAADWAGAVRAILQRFNLTRQQDRLPRELTLADRKRVEIARAIVGNCRVLMLDESLSGLTHDEADEIVAEIRKINREDGTTILIVEHVMPVIMKLAQRLIVLNYGRIIASGPPSVIAQDPEVITAYLGKTT